MLVLIYGHKGWIGTKVIKLLQEQNIEFFRGNVRVNNKLELEEEIKTVNPTHIMSFIGRTHGKGFTTIDYLEQKGKIYENVRDNLFSPLLLAILCKKYNIHFTYMGTGCIFKFDKDHPYEKEVNGFTEECLPNFFGSGYSVVKGFTDELMHMFKDTVLNLRIRMPISDDWSTRNFIYKITHYEKICSIKNSMTVLPELLPLMIDMAKNKVTGTINMTNPGLISHNRILELYKEIVDKDFTWKNFSIEEQAKILAADRSNNYLDTSKIERMYKVDNIETAIIKILKYLSK
jgi:3,5-epimerase/4-reductase